MASGREEDRVWIMDPDVLEDSARDHRDSPPPPPPPQPLPPLNPPAPPLPAFPPPTTLADGQQKISVLADSSSVRRNDSGLFFKTTDPNQASPTSGERMSAWRPSGGTGGTSNVAKTFNRPGMNHESSAGTGGTQDSELNFMEKQFLLACERGDLASVRHYLGVAKLNKDFNINCVDPLGRTALLIAIENENIEMIETLLESCVETGDAILYAINEENVEAVEIILNHLEKVDKFSPEAIVNHQGTNYEYTDTSKSCPHYFVDVRDPTTNKWLLLDDTYTAPKHPSIIAHQWAKTVYMALYESAN